MSSEPPTAHGPRRRALVTGASSGIGRAFAQRLAADAYDLALVARNGEALEALAAELRERRKANVRVQVADLTRSDELRGVEALVAGAPPVDLLVNNAGMGTAGPFAESDAEAEEREIRLNVLALVRLTRAALPGMIERGHGDIINVSSLAALMPSPFTATYAATKAFVNSFSEAVYEELRGSGVRVQALCPGFTRTDFQRRAGVDTSQVPSFAWMDPESVVESSLSALATGAAVCVPGAANRALAAASAAMPRALLRRAAGAALGRRYRR